MLAETEKEFISIFEQVKNDKSITGIMFQQPLPENLSNLINEVSPERDVEGISINNIGKLFVGKKDALIPCTSRAVMEALDYYNEFATIDYAETDVVSDIFVDAEELYEEEKATEE